MGLLEVKMRRITCVMLILIAVLLFGGLSDVLCDEVHIILPSSDYPCSNSSCMTLSQFAESNIVSDSLIFAAGHHTLNVSVSVSNIDSLFMFAADNGSVNITCTDSAYYFNLTSIDLVNISNLTFIACGNSIESVKLLTIKWSTFTGGENRATGTLLSIVKTNMYVDTTYFLNGTGASPMLSEVFSGSIGGAMIVMKSNATIYNSVFKANRANNGGAMYFGAESNITINNCVFTFNSARSCVNRPCLGGALFVNETNKVFITNSTFENNTSEKGGMIVVFNATLLVSNCSILRNTATSNGGIIAAFHHSVLVLNISTLKSATAYSGGAIYLEGGSLNISGCTITNNSARLNGGVLFVLTEGHIVIDNNTNISDNRAASGAVIHTIKDIDISNEASKNADVKNTVKVKISIRNSLFSNNEAGLDGGVLSLTFPTSSNVTNSTFSHNTAGRRGGVISMYGRKNLVIILSSTFSHNTATIYGGVASVLYGGRLLAKNSSFDSNVADIHGGVFDCYSLGDITLIRSNFSNNSADTGGGVVNMKNGSTLLMTDSHFFQNANTDLGAVVLAINRNNITIHSCNFTKNSAIYGGVMIATLKNIITVSNSTFYINRAISNGGTIYTRRSCTTIVTNCTFRNNTAFNDGTIIAAGSSKFRVESSNFYYNIAGHDGGVAYAYRNSTIDFHGCHFNGNRAENSGGVIYGLKNSTIKVNNSVCECNCAQNSGGGIHAQRNSSVIIEASNISTNIADYGGGVRVYVKSVAKIRNCYFAANKANVAGGSLAAYENSTISVQMSNFPVNMANVGGVAIALQSTLNNAGHNTDKQRLNVISFQGSNFTGNAANLGGVLYIHGSHVAIENNTFIQNQATHKGGVIYSIAHSSVYIDYTRFTNNLADDGGVMIVIDNSQVQLNSSVFTNNTAEQSGGVIHLHQSSANVYSSVFNSSHAGTNGGVLAALNSSVNVKASYFWDNFAHKKGGAVDAYSGSNLTIENSNFLSNKAGELGGSLHVEVNSSGYIFNSTFQQNIANKRGGAISVLSSSKIIISGCDNRSYFDNAAQTGVAASAINETMSSNSNCRVNVDNNEAIWSGGGIYLEKSDFFFRIDTNMNISFNKANKSGGGLHAVNSSIVISPESNIVFHSNQACQGGGGISLANSKFYDTKDKGRMSNLSLIQNHANEGGAIYIDDASEGSVCSNNPFKGVYLKESGCFFQNASNLYFKFFNNTATGGGDESDLFGGLLDRCTTVERNNYSLSNLEPRGVSQFLSMSNLTSNGAITSQPVRLCLCSEMIVNCSQQTTTIDVKMQDSFSFYVVAVDQVNRNVSATVRSSFTESDDITLEESETIRRIGDSCSKLKYRVPFKKSRETYKMTIFPQGPCGNKGISMTSISIHVVDCTCPPGFMKAKIDTKCECVCDKRYKTFTKYITECDTTTQLVIRKGSFWISYLGNSVNTRLSPYFIYPDCPLDYCQPPSKEITINLSLPNGPDSQCANNRGGILCGKCLPNYSLSLGSSKCIKCPDNWYGLLITIIIAAFFAGIILVIGLLTLNLTVAIGTLNSIIFYANIIYTNRSIYFRHSSLTLASAFISWTNLNIGIDVCFIKGMDSYTKVWLELAFPIYIIFLVIVIIIVSSRSQKVSHLLGKKNPVATLATLILLSYNKLLETIIVSFSFITLKYPNGTVVTKWLPDASVHFRGWKHVALICMGTLILILGLLYTTVIFSWQWVLRCPRSKILRWIRNQKLHSFIGIYHIPYTAQHRYWTGLLLLVRVIVYLVSTFTLSVDPRISLLSTIITMGCLSTYKISLTFLNQVYRHRLLNIMESIVHLNIAVFAAITWYALDEHGNSYEETIQRIFAYISVGMIFVLLLLVIIYHICRYASVKVYTTCLSSNFVKVMKCLLEHCSQEQASPNRDNYNLMDFIDDPREMEGYTAPPPLLHHAPTITTTTVSMTESVKSESP